MAALLDVASWALIVAGAGFMLTGGIGLLRLPDLFTRMHGASLIDSMGAGLLLSGFMLQEGFTLVSAKMVMILIFIFFTSPAATYALARAAMYAGIMPKTDADSVRRAEDAAASGREDRSSKTS